MSKFSSGSRNDKAQSGAPVEQVREILFGAQLKDMEVRFQRQEERLLREIQEVKDSLRKRLDSLENFMKSEVSSLLARLKEEQNEREATLKAEQRERCEAIKAEQRERTELISAEERERAEAIKNEQRERAEAFATLTSDILAATESFERKMAKLSNTIDTAERELRELVMLENGRLNDKVENKYNDALNVLAKTAAQIRSDMVYRTAMSSMLTEVVVGLSQPWNMEVSHDEDQSEPESQESFGDNKDDGNLNNSWNQAAETSHWDNEVESSHEGIEIQKN